jgi:hypothetical protein
MLPQWPRLLTQALERAAHGAPEQAAVRVLAEAVERQRKQVQALSVAVLLLAAGLLAWLLWFWRH